jgi:hypothetical protein
MHLYEPEVSNTPVTTHTRKRSAENTKELRKSSKQGKYLEKVLELEDDDPRSGESEAGSSAVPPTPNAHHAYGLTILKTNIPLHGTRELGISPGQPRGDRSSLQTELFKREKSPSSEASGGDISHIFRVDPESLYYPEDYKSSYYGITKAHVGNAATEPLHFLPIEVSKHNAQLLHFCQYFSLNFSLP